MNIAVIGTGYVGVTISVVFAAGGHKVSGVDIDEKKVSALNKGVLPFYEKGIEPLLKKLVLEGNLQFSTDLARAVLSADILFLAVGTPPAEDGSAELRYIKEAVRQIGLTMDTYKVIVVKSTSPVGTAELVKSILQYELSERGLNLSYDVVSNPEFLREESAL